MTLCRKCGKEIPDGQELCEECQGAELDIDQAYLDELMQSMAQEQGEENESVPESPVAEEPAEEPVEEPVAELVVEEEPLEEPVAQQETDSSQATEEMSGDENINELLALLSQDYEEYDEPVAEEESEEVPMEILDESPAEATLFREEDEGEGLFADESDSLSVDDIFGDALSAVGYSEADDEDPQEEVQEEFIPPEEDLSSPFDASLDPLVLDDSELALVSEGELEEATASEQGTDVVSEEKKPSIWKRVFGNIITEQSAEEEAKEREKEQVDAEEKALAREEKKKKAAEEKAEKAEQAKQEKEKKAAEKAEKAAVKAAEKEEKKRLKAEREAQEVVGRINPVGASIVMAFFGVLCVLTILGTQSLSYTSSVRHAESSFDERNYKDAYDSLAGVDVSDSSKELKDKVRICMQLQRELDAYENYYKLKMYLESLDSLMKGIRSYDSNKGKAEEYEILGQYNELEGRLANQLYEEFGVSESQARNINSSKTQEEYTSRLENIIAQWEKRNKEDER